jgi:hypothetical protein
MLNMSTHLIRMTHVFINSLVKITSHLIQRSNDKVSCKYNTVEITAKSSYDWNRESAPKK